MSLLDDICVAVGRIGRCLFDAVMTIYKLVVSFVADVCVWARDLFNRCRDKILEGWRVYYVDIDVEKIPSSVIPQERLRGARKVSLGIMTDENLKPKKVDRAYVHTYDDADLSQALNDGVVELVS